MDVKALINYCVVIRENHYVMGRPLKVMFCRFNYKVLEAKENEIYIMPRGYISEVPIKEIGNTEAVYNGRFQDHILFEVEWELGNDSRMRRWDDPIDYYRSQMHWKAIGSRFSYTDNMYWDKSVSYPEGYLTKESLPHHHESTMKMMAMIRTFFKNVIADKGRGERWEEKMTYKEDSINTLHSLTESVITGKGQERIDAIKRFLKVRHEVFLYFLCMLMGWDYTKSDIDLPQEVNYNGQYCHYSPDLLVKASQNKYYLVEVAVTDADTTIIINNKLSKYTKLVEDMNQTMVGLEFELLIFVLNTRDLQDSAFPVGSVDELVNQMEDVVALSRRLSKLDVYNTVKRDLDRDWVEHMQNKEAMFKRINEHLLEGTTLAEKKAPSLARSREGKEKVFVTNHEDRLCNELLQGLSDPTQTYDKLLMDMREHKEPGKGGAVMSQLNNKGAVVAVVMRERDKMKALRASLGFDYKQTKMCKLPFIKLGKEFYIDMSSLGRVKAPLEDGTVQYYEFFDPVCKEGHSEENRAGLGMDPDLDRDYVESFHTYLTQRSNSKAMTTDWLMEFKDTNAYKSLTMLEMLCRDIMLLEGRRSISSDGGKMRVSSVARNSGYYVVLIDKMGGTKLSVEKTIRFKIITRQENILFSRHLHRFSKRRDDTYESKWLAITQTDIEHYQSIASRTVALMSHVRDLFLESGMLPNVFTEKWMLSKTMLMPCMVMMEGKRGTSTTNQLWRYLMMSLLSMYTNRTSLMESVSEAPIRSTLEAHIRECQWAWYLHEMENAQAVWVRMLKTQASTAPEHDRFSMSSFYNLGDTVEFSLLMNDIYICNMFNKKSGFRGHRSKAIMEKMVSEEKNFLKTREEVIGTLSFKRVLNEKTPHHLFNKDFVNMIGVMMRKTLQDTGKREEKVFEALMTAASSMMLGTVSLIGGPLVSPNLEYSDKLKKNFVFETILAEVRKIGTAQLLRMVDKQEMVDAVFSLFPKQQIGGPREILIMAVVLRYQVKLMEAYFYSMCSIHPKEMNTKGSMKANIQAESMLNAKMEKMRLRKNQRKGKPPLDSFYFSINSDSSKWAPAMVMEELIVFVNAVVPETHLREFFISVLRAFSTKRMFIPNDLADKWKMFPMDRREASDDMEWLRKKSKEEGYAPEFFSGMGQGMFNYLSSLYHCAVDDAFDKLMADFYGTAMKVIPRTQISSDDKTKNCLVVYRRGMNASDLLGYYYMFFDAVGRLANIHINWKKTGFSLVVTEFNSLFSVGKRMCLAVVKDLYTVFDMVDTTKPESAVRAVLSQVQRVLFAGAFLPTIKIILSEWHDRLIKIYNITADMRMRIKDILGTTDDNMPYHLGFIPTSMPIETLIYGPDVHMYKKVNSHALNKFYRAVHSAFEGKLDSDPNMVFTDQVPGKYRLVLPTRLDKRVKALSEKFTEEHGGKESLSKEMNKMALVLTNNPLDPIMFRMFVINHYMGLKKDYAFGDSMKIHSNIRAMALSRKKATFTPSKVEGDAVDFVEFLMQKLVDKSSYEYMKPLAILDEIHTNNERRLLTAQGTRRVRHPKLRELRFQAVMATEGASPGELMEALFDKGQTPKARVVSSMVSFCRAMGISMEEVSQDPYKAIRRLFPSSMTPFLDFKSFVDHQTNLNKMTKVEMVCDFPDTGSVNNNLWNLYRSKSDPEMVYGESGETILDTTEDLVKTIMNRVALGKDISDITTDEDILAEGTDQNLELACKHIVAYNSKKAVTGRSKVLFTQRDTENSITKMYYNCHSIIEVRETARGMVVKAFSLDKELDVSRDLFYMASKDILEYRAKGHYEDHRDGDIRYTVMGVTFNVSQMPDMASCVLKRGVKNWSLMIRHNGLSMDMPILRGEPYYLHKGYLMETEDFHEFQMMMMEALSPYEVQDIFTKNGWLEENPDSAVKSTTLKEIVPSDMFSDDMLWGMAGMNVLDIFGEMAGGFEDIKEEAADEGEVGDMTKMMSGLLDMDFSDFKDLDKEEDKEIDDLAVSDISTVNKLKWDVVRRSFNSNFFTGTSTAFSSLDDNEFAIGVALAQMRKILLDDYGVTNLHLAKMYTAVALTHMITPLDLMLMNNMEISLYNMHMVDKEIKRKLVMKMEKLYNKDSLKKEFLM